MAMKAAVSALVGPREMYDLSPQSGPKDIDQVPVTNRNFMSTRLRRHPLRV